MEFKDISCKCQSLEWIKTLFSNQTHFGRLLSKLLSVLAWSIYDEVSLIGSNARSLQHSIIKIFFSFELTLAQPKKCTIKSSWAWNDLKSTFLCKALTLTPKTFGMFLLVVVIVRVSPQFNDVTWPKFKFYGTVGMSLPGMPHIFQLKSLSSNK